ncbi:hypothetical protein THOM_0156 [Trachipleistophora hominis]|uniref:Uncharacterized protein n=1 Tax=Trachipleistophora hominis TaxID=72359 RepID=L7JZE5_TRAHO|nr:hypothetical protein THOM_0156 [Trachipleistophora hominis]
MHIGSYQPILHTVKTFFQHSSQEMDENRENNTLINDDGINTFVGESFVEVNTRSRADDNLYSTGNVAKMNGLESAKHVISEKTGANRTTSTEKIPYVTDSSGRYDLGIRQEQQNVTPRENRVNKYYTNFIAKYVKRGHQSVGITNRNKNDN